MPKPAPDVFRKNGLQGGRESSLQQGAGTSRTRAQERFELRPARFDRREVWGIGRQKEDGPTGAAHGLFDVRGAMHLQVVEEDNIPRSQSRHSHLRDKHVKDRRIDRPLHPQRGHHAADPERPNHGEVLAMVSGHGPIGSLAAGGTGSS
jgi:hypothetical protein